MNTITANQLKTKGISVTESVEDHIKRISHDV